MTSVFAYRAPTDEDKVHLAALQRGFIAIERLLKADQLVYIFGDLETEERLALQRGLTELNAAVVEHVPDGHERDSALLKLRLSYECVLRQQYMAALDLLRECRSWANAGIVLVREEGAEHVG